MKKYRQTISHYSSSSIVLYLSITQQAAADDEREAFFQHIHVFNIIMTYVYRGSIVCFQTPATRLTYTTRKKRPFENNNDI